MRHLEWIQQQPLFKPRAKVLDADGVIYFFWSKQHLAHQPARLRWLTFIKNLFR